MSDASGERLHDPNWRGPPPAVLAWCALAHDGSLIPNSVRDRLDAVRLAAGECVPVRVRISYEPEQEREAEWAMAAQHAAALDELGAVGRRERDVRQIVGTLIRPASHCVCNPLIHIAVNKTRS